MLPDFCSGYTTSFVRVSNGAGVTWTDVGQSDLGKAWDLSLSADGKTLFLGTDRGLWRYQLR